MFRANEKTRVSEDIVEQIVDLIRSRDLEPGDRLPGERQLSETLGVSRNSTREALRKLETMGLVEIQQGRGTFVKDPSSEVLRGALVPHLFRDPRTLQKLFELREIIEVDAAARAARRINQTQVEKIRHWLQRMQRGIERGDIELAITADVEFHRQILVATENDILVDLMDEVIDMLRDMRRLTPGYAAQLPKALKQHRAILAALEAGDGEAAKEAMGAHLQHVRENSDLLDSEKEGA